MSPRLAALSAAAVTAAVAASPALAQSPAGQTIKFRELNKGSHFRFIDNAPRTKFAKQEPKSLSAGDQFVFGAPLADATGRIGDVRVTCAATKDSKTFENAHLLCTGAFVLRAGTLFIAVAATRNTVTTGAVTGGTGAYVGARGSFTSTDTKTAGAKANDVVTLVP